MVRVAAPTAGFRTFQAQILAIWRVPVGPAGSRPRRLLALGSGVVEPMQPVNPGLGQRRSSGRCVPACDQTQKSRRAGGIGTRRLEGPLGAKGQLYSDPVTRIRLDRKCRTRGYKGRSTAPETTVRRVRRPGGTVPQGSASAGIMACRRADPGRDRQATVQRQGRARGAAGLPVSRAPSPRGRRVKQRPPQPGLGEPVRELHGDVVASAP